MAHQWEVVEGYLTGLLAGGFGQFNSAAMAADLGVSGRQATHLIQSYLDAQRRPKSRTAYVLHRTGQTKNAMWHIGDRAVDARAIGKQFLRDMAIKASRAIEPDLAKIGVSNAQAVKVTTSLANVIEASIQHLATVL